MPTTITLPVLPIRQDGHRVFLTAMRAEDLAVYTKVDTFDPSKPIEALDQGYQRRVEKPRVKKFANWLRRAVEEGEGILVPTSILASSRGVDLRYDERKATITLTSASPLHLVDGQHRAAGFLHAITERELDEAREVEMPLVVVEGLDRHTEMRQFATVNGTQKSVRTDLVNMILTQLAANGGDEAIREGEQWKVVVSHVVKAVNDDPTGPWYRLVVMPNEQAYKKVDIDATPALEHQKIVRATSFMTSLKPIYDYLATGFFDGLSTEERAQLLGHIVTSFWLALKKLNPEAFARPGDHVIQKTPGLFALHMICKRLLPIMHLARRKWDEENFVAMLEPCEELGNPDYWTAKRGEGITVGEAAKYGSMKGFAELAELLWESLKS